MGYEIFVRTELERRIAENEDEAYGTQKASSNKEYLPIRRTLKDFLVTMRIKIEIYAEHLYELKLSRRSSRCIERRHLIEPAINNNCPDEYKGFVTSHVDFSSVIRSQRGTNLTCSFTDSHFAIAFEPCLVTIERIADMHPRTARRLEKKGIDRTVVATHVIVYAFSNKNPCEAYNTTSHKHIMSILKHGTLSDGKAEAFMNGKRIPGGDNSDSPIFLTLFAKQTLSSHMVR